MRALSATVENQQSQKINTPFVDEQFVLTGEQFEVRHVVRHAVRHFVEHELLSRETIRV